MTFSKFFREIWDKDPFPWQERLASLALEGHWPSSIGLPTAAGKTALIDIAVFALANGAPNSARRIFFVVDRRVIVDEAAERADKLAERLNNSDSPVAKAVAKNLRALVGDPDSSPLKTAVLRGGIARDDSWTDSPLQPLVICSTVDQLGSGLLFRAYDARQYNWPIRAALAAFDSIIILDEAHTSQPFAETLEWLRKYRSWAERPIPGSFTVVEMSATPRETEEVFKEEPSDIEHEVLNARWRASKRARLVQVEPCQGEEAASGGLTALAQNAAREARALRESGAKVIGVVVNRVRTARTIFENLHGDDGSEAILLTGRARPYDRDRIWKEWRRRIGLGREENPSGKPVFVVATQCIEVGANIDFDALVTEVASIDALEQRFGRLNRGGRGAISRAAIVAQKDQVSAKFVDAVYGSALSATWKWLDVNQSTEERILILPAEGKRKPKSRKEKIRYIEMGVLAIREALRATAERSGLAMPRRSAPVLMPAHLDLLCQTSPEPALAPEPSLFLHGLESGPQDARVLWRADLDAGLGGNGAPEQRAVLWTRIVAMCPPGAAETISLPVWSVRRWLSGQNESDLADIEGLASAETHVARAKGPVLQWRGADESQILNDPADIRPGMTLVAPATYGGCDEWGWDPLSGDPVTDVGDAVRLEMSRPILRIDPSLANSHGYTELATKFRNCETEGDVRAVLAEFQVQTEGWVSTALNRLSASRKLQLIEQPAENQEGLAAIAGRGEFQEDTMSVFEGQEVLLTHHLEGCEAWVSKFAVLVPADLAHCLNAAARYHDIGKADPRFQAWLRGGLPLKPHELIAKSARTGQNAGAIERARQRAGYPRGGRHELLSIALLNGNSQKLVKLDFDLVLHLIASHHGRCRPFAPVVDDPNPVEVTYNGQTASSAHKMETAGSGITERFWRLTERYGWYGLAWLETLLRLADHRQSEAEQKLDQLPTGATHA